MKNLIIVLSVFLAVSTAASAQKATSTSQKEVQKTTYTCPMHPKEMSAKQGNCPKCGMAMTSKEDGKTMYKCPMHPKEMSGKEGACGKCGMKMVKTTKLNHDTSGKGRKSSKEVVTKYVCTMDGTTSNKPGKCPKCGMKMMPKDSVKKEENHKH